MPRWILATALTIHFGIGLPLVGQAPSTIPPSTSKAPRFTYSVVRTHPHDPTAYTQGLEYRNGFFFESTGLYGRSSLRRVALDSGKVLQEHRLREEYFGEGITLLDKALFQLTWQSQIGFVHDAASFEVRRTFKYSGEGWGLTNDGKVLVMSDGSSTLRFLNPTTLGELRRVRVTDASTPIVNLNELEWIRGEVWANVYQTDYIVRISPQDGRVVGWIDLRGLLAAPYATAAVDVLNGIAYDVKRDRLFVTGKLWPRLFEIQIKASK